MTAVDTRMGETVIAGHVVHPYADLYPMLDGDEMAELVESIGANGLVDEIELAADGRLVDGRNRAAACLAAGVEPRTVVLDDLDSDEKVAAYVSVKNDDRRHLSPGQQAMGRALALWHQGRRVNGRWAYGALNSRDSGNLTKAESDLMTKAGLVLDWTDLSGSVMDGTLALDAAYQQAKEIQRVKQADEIEAKRGKALEEAERKRAAERLADLRESRPDLAALVDEGRLPLNDALSVRDKELAAERKAAADAAEWHRKRLATFSESLFGLRDLIDDEGREWLVENWTPQTVLDREWTSKAIAEIGGRLTRLAKEWTH